MRRCAAVLCAVLLLGAAPAVADSGDILPDLDQLAPGGLVVKKRASRLRLGFSSAAANVGDGPLTLHGYRPSRKVKRMRVDQLVDQVMGAARLVLGVGRMSYVVHPDHKHWHLLGFERYELRSGNGRRLLGDDRKTGFCLGDRYSIRGAAKLDGFVPVALQGDTCGLGEPGLLGLFAGISVGWADRYLAHVEGQYVDVSGLPTGTYQLVHRVNVDGKILESDYSNNASSVRFRFVRRGDRVPRVKVVRRCGRSGSCPR